MGCGNTKPIYVDEQGMPRNEHVITNSFEPEVTDCDLPNLDEEDNEKDPVRANNLAPKQELPKIEIKSKTSQPKKKQKGGPKKVTTEEKIKKLTEAIERVQKAPDVLADSLTDDISQLTKRFSNASYNEDPAINSKALQLGIIQLCLRIWKDLFQADFLHPDNKNLWNIMKKFIIVLWNGSDWSNEACEILIKEDAHSYFLNVLEDGKLQEPDESSLVPDVYDRQAYTIIAIFAVIHNILLHLGEPVRKELREKNAVRIFQERLQSKNEVIKAEAYINLAHLITEEENEIINADDAHIQYMVCLLHDAVNSKNRRSKKGVEAMEMIKALNKLAVNDNNKDRINNCGALEYYERLLMEGVTEEEQITLIHGIWTLAFHPNCKNTISNMPNLYSTLKTLTSHNNEQLRNTVHGALWVLEGGHPQKETEKKTEPSPEGVQHIMISYNWDVKPTVLKIRDRLKEAGFKVWMDVDNMTGSTLEAMAQAIENAAVVVICMTHKYKESPSCRTEAEYTYQLRKPIVPLRLEAGYKADGWLGIMVGTKLWFDFIKNFQKAMVGLIKELGNRGRLTPASDIQSLQDIPTQPLAVTSSKQLAHKSWSAAEVNTWLKDNGLGHQASRLSAVDGSLLEELNDMRRNAPEFFYNYLINDNMQFTLIDILTFTKALNKL